MRTSLIYLAILTVPHAIDAQRGPRVDLKPILDLSADAPSGAPQFSSVTSAIRFDDGTIVIADGDELALRFFDRSGKLVRAVGRAGGGPGEFRSLNWLGRCGGDSLFAWDAAQQRMSVFGANGTYVRQFTLGAHAAPIMTLACNGAGEVIFQDQPKPARRSRPQSSGNTRQDRILPTTAGIQIVDRTGTHPRALGDWSAGTWYRVGTGTGPLPLGTMSYVAAAGARMFVGTADSVAAISVWSGAKGPATITLKIPRRRPTAAEHQRAAAAAAAIAPRAMRDVVEDSLDKAPMPDALPPYAGLFGDRDGVLWVLLTVPGDDAIRLRAIGARNQVLGDVALPADVTVDEVDHDAIVATYTDTDDLPHVVVYRLHRGP